MNQPESARNDQREVPSSWGECMLWLMEALYGAPGMMNIPLTLRLRGALDIGALKRALQGLVDRHDTLRSAFKWDDTRAVGFPGSLACTLRERVPATLNVEDVSTLPNPQAAAWERMRARLHENIDTAAGPLFKFDLFTLAADDHILLLNVHHIATDAWSTMLLGRDLAALYNEAAAGVPAGLPDIAWPYERFAERQRDRIASPAGERHKAYWRGKLADGRYLELQPAPEREGGRKPLSENARFTIGQDVLKRLRDLAREERCTLYVVMLAVFFSALHSVSGRSELSTGSLLANRTRREFFSTLGFFANMVLLTVRLPEEPSLRDVVKAARADVLETLDHQESPFLIYVSDPSMPPNAYLTTDIVFHMLTVPDLVPAPGELKFAGLETTVYPIPDAMGNRFDFELMLAPDACGLRGRHPVRDRPL